MQQAVLLVVVQPLDRVVQVHLWIDRVLRQRIVDLRGPTFFLEGVEKALLVVGRLPEAFHDHAAKPQRVFCFVPMRLFRRFGSRAMLFSSGHVTTPPRRGDVRASSIEKAPSYWTPILSIFSKFSKMGVAMGKMDSLDKQL